MDDDPAIAELTAEFFESVGFKARVLLDPRPALQEIVSWHPDALILDLEMPNLNGVEVLNQVRSDPQTSGLPVVIVSIVAEETWRTRRLDAVQGIFCKPLSYARLLDRVKEIVQGASGNLPYALSKA